MLVVAPGGAVKWAHLASDAGDNPPMEQPQAFLAALHAAIATQTEREPA